MVELHITKQFQEFSEKEFSDNQKAVQNTSFSSFIVISRSIEMLQSLHCILSIGVCKFFYSRELPFD